MNTTTIDPCGNVYDKEIALLADPDELLEIGRPLQGRYDTYFVNTLLAETFQSRVYHGISKQGRKIVIKEYLQNDKTRSFQREKFVASKVEHPHIVTAYDFMIECDRPLCIFPFMEGRTLEGVIQKEALPDQEDIVPIVSTLCDAADHTHSLNIVHRDIKPSNIIISEAVPGKLVPQLLDFGSAWHPDLAGHDVVEGYYATPAYMAPEKLGFSAPDKREDIFSLAVMFYELLSMVVPFDTDSFDELFKLHAAKAPVPDLTRFSPFVSDEVKAVLEKGMDYDLDQRYQTAGEFKRAYLKAVGRK